MCCFISNKLTYTLILCQFYFCIEILNADCWLWLEHILIGSHIVNSIYNLYKFRLMSTSNFQYFLG